MKLRQLLSALLLFVPAIAAPPAHARDWGAVSGWILDAETRLPVAGARVLLEVDGEFPSAGRSTASTGKEGGFRAQMPLGSISSRLDWGRVLTMHPISLILSPKSVLKETRILDVTYANVAVEAPGYRPFRGRVRAALLNAGKFAVELEDIWLARESSALHSFSPERFRSEVIEGLTVEPAVAAPGERVRITLTARLPVQRGRKYRAYATSSAIRLVPDQLELKESSIIPPEEAGALPVPWAGSPRVVFSQEVTLPERPLENWSEIGFFLVRDDRLLLRQSNTRALLQIAGGEKRAAAEAVAAGYLFERLARRGDALQQYEAALKLEPGHEFALRRSAELLAQVGRREESAARWRDLAASPAAGTTVAAGYASALIDAGRAAEALDLLRDLPERGVTRSAAARWRLQRARALAGAARFAEADQELARAATLDERLPPAQVASVHLLRLEHAVAAAPDDPELLQSLAAAQEGAGRRDAAVASLAAAAARSADDAWLLADLARLLLQADRRTEAILLLRRALEMDEANPEFHLLLAGALRGGGDAAAALPHYERAADQAPLDPRALLGLGLCRLAVGDQPAGEKTLQEAVRQGRAKGELRDPGLIGFYWGPKRRLAAGFDLPEAAAAAALLDALSDLKRNPEEALFQQNAGHALLELGMPDRALPYLREAVRLDPGLLESRFLLGQALSAAGDEPAARAEISLVVKRNPLHPRARLELARLLAAAGEDAEAQRLMLEQMRHYPLLRTSPAGG